ncbi:MAG: carotenoid oxygenase family protein [Acaryochloridaceae cyanobacterium RL_2_7]|nr:carotenoid oxygenase family protein [Acaryochloridaceae cyanobacterium RL_2_7]
MVSGQPSTVAEACLWQGEINLDRLTLVNSEVLVPQVSEFPTVSPLEVGRQTSATYFSMNHDSAPRLSLLQNIGRYDHQSGLVQTSQLPESHYGMEPLFAPDRRGVTDGWILTVVYDSDRHQSEVWIFAAKHLEHPICRLQLPSVIPIGFHGQWVAA